MSTYSPTALAGFAHEPLARGADERHCLGEQDTHRVTERERLLVRAALRLDPRQRRGGQLVRRVQRQRGELLALGLGYRLRLLLRELAQAAHQVLGITPERKAEAALFHALTVAVTRGRPCNRPPRRARARRRRPCSASSPLRRASAGLRRGRTPTGVQPPRSCPGTPAKRHAAASRSSVPDRVQPAPPLRSPRGSR